jgi:PAS domain S-box-containing protein
MRRRNPGKVARRKAPALGSRAPPRANLRQATAGAQTRALRARIDELEAQLARASCLHAMVDYSQDHLVYLDRDFNFVRVNRAYAETCRKAPEEFVGHNHFSFYPDPENQVIFERVRDTGVPEIWREKPFVFPDQPERGVTYWDWTLSPVKDDQATVQGLVFSLRDVTEKVRARQRVEEGEQRFRLALKNAPVSVAAQDRELRYLWSYNQRDMLNASVLGKTDADLFQHEDARRLATLKRTVLETGVELRDQLWLTSGGRRVFLDICLEPIRDDRGRVTGVGFATVDLTQTKLVEEALRASEERFAKAFQASPMALGIVDAQTQRLVEVNDAWVDIFGFPMEEAVGRTCIELGIYTSDDERSGFLAKALKCRSGDAPEAQLRGKDGKSVHVMMRSSSLELGGRPCLLSAIIDVTKRRMAEEAVQRANESLQESDRRKDEFLGVLSHELRNPLAPIRNSLYILEHTAPESDQAQRAKATIDRQINQLVRLVDDLLDVTRISRNKIRLQRQSLDLGEVVYRTTEDHRSMFEKNGLSLEVTTPVAPIFVDADWTRLAQVVGNLLHNAAKFTPRGGSVQVTVSSEPAGHAVIRIRDSGVGMAPEVLGRLFQPFIQADRTLDRSKGGLGLGLALTKGLVELHGGEIGAHSDGPGRGAEFMIRLPLDASEPRTERPAGPPTTPQRRRVLIIEDNVDAANTLREVLEISGHTVEVAFDGPAGLARAHDFGPDVVLCDIGLPGMDGYQVARSLRADDSFKDLRLIALSGYSSPEDVQRAIEAGFGGHLAKPPSLEKLEELLLAEGPGVPPDALR